MQFYYVYVVSSILIAFGYMLFDVLNKREVPNLFAYSTLVFSFVVILISGSLHLILESYLIAFVILGFGYFIYKAGQLGLGDVFEFAALSLLLAPISVPLIAYMTPGVALPSVISLFLDTGIAAIIAVPLFYICVATKRFGRSVTDKIRGADVFKAIAVVVAYAAFVAILSQISQSDTLLFSIMFFIVLGSALLLLFQRPITEVMVEHVGYSGFTEDDIIAFNLMSDGEISRAKKSVRNFDRLVTKKMIAEMRKKRIKQKFPVYKQAVPFAVPIFLGTLLTIIVGNILIVALIG